MVGDRSWKLKDIDSVWDILIEGTKIQSSTVGMELIISDTGDTPD